MNQDLLFKQFQEFEDRVARLRYAMSIIGWDAATRAPKGGLGYRAKMVGGLNSDMYALQMDPQNLSMLEAVATGESFSPGVRRSAQLHLKNINKIRYIPQELYAQNSELLATSGRVWEDAKANNDYAMFAPYLEKIVNMLKKFLELRKAEGDPYDTLLGDFEENWNTERYDAFFDALKKSIVPLAARIRESGRKIDDSLLYAHFPRPQQEELVNYLVAQFGFDTHRAIWDVSVHPFTNSICPTDVRMTVRFLENYFPASLFAAIHECGHAIHNLQANPALAGTGLFGSPSMALAESQSRFLENYIGRSQAFWDAHFPKMWTLFPEQLKSYDSESFYQVINRSKSSFIRMEADELTYPLHILLRYELEREIINGRLAISDIPKAWNDKSEELLGIRPDTDTLGCLQDMHWSSSSSFGYFPTYALGSAYGAQFYAAMKKSVDVDKALREGETAAVTGWLKENIHQYGKFYTPDQVLQRTTGSAFDVKYYTDYLTEKFTALYF